LIQTFLFHANLVGRISARWAKVPRVVSGIRVAERHSRWHLRLDRLTAGLVDRYVCVSESVAKFSAAHGLPPDKLAVIPNVIDVAAFSGVEPADLRQFGVPQGSTVVTYVGRLGRQKGLDWLLESAPMWIDRAPECHLLLVGQGPEKTRLEGIRDRLVLGPRVHLAGWRKDVAAILAASRLLVLPSRWEGMPNVVLQAMASGLPVVATDVEGVRELLGEHAGPQTVPFGDGGALADALLAFLSDPSRAAEIGRHNRRRVETAFTLPRMVTAYEALWSGLTG
jgi:glycosyltransferase involved in cell wall biosynthesis